MYFNFNFSSDIALPVAMPRSPTATPLPDSLAAVTGNHVSEITVLTSIGHAANKRFYLDENQQVAKDNFQNAYLFDAATAKVGSIDDLAKLIELCSTDNHRILIRGLPVNRTLKRIRKTGENFAEHSNGTPWAMLDFDNISVPDGIDPLSAEAIEWVIAKLPAEFHNVAYFYQHSGSAGILKSDGSPLKSGLNVHLFFWLNRRVPGRSLAAYLSLHCLETGFYTPDKNHGGNVNLLLGIDPAPLRSEVQAHYIAAPTIEAGVNCRVTPEVRQGLIRKPSDCVVIPEFSYRIEHRAQALKSRLLSEYKRRHGYTTKISLTNVRGRVAATRYSVAPNRTGESARTGRTLAEVKLSGDEKYLTLYFADEGTPGSWYVCKDRPQLGVRHGDNETLPLLELSQGAHEYVRDELRWFSEVPHRHLELVGGFLPPLNAFATAKVSLVLSPTGSGKTTAAIDWIRDRIAQRQLVLYAAPTIALVKQMQDDLTQAQLNPAYYDSAWGMSFPRSGVIVTTNDSLPRLLKEVYNNDTPHVLIFDEIHQGLDRFMSHNRNLQNLEGALSKARQSLLLTGTLTDVQRHAIVDVTKQALGSLTETDYCCYEFAAFKRNPLNVLPTSRFDSDLATLLEGFRELLENREALPRFVMLLDTSKMEMYRSLVAEYGLAEHAMIVSRPESCPDEIEEARTSDKPILISSPLFGLGLNFSNEPAILWARFDHVAADTSQIVQAVNRANRGQLQCDVRIYGNVQPDLDFAIPEKVRLKDDIANRLGAETSVAGLLEDHFQLDRVTYLELRRAERNSQVALSTLVRDNAIQNFTVVECDDLPEVSKAKAKVVKAARAGARLAYKRAVVDASEEFAGIGAMHAMIKLEQLHEVRKNNWKSDDPRLARDLENEEAAIFMGSFGITDPIAAQKVRSAKVMRLQGDLSSWISAQYDRDRHPEWAKAEAEKTDKLIVLLEKLRDFRDGRVTVEDLSAGLTRNSQFGEAFQALASSDTEFLNVGKKVDALKTARDKLRLKGGDQQRAEVREGGLELLRELLGPLGIAYGKKGSRGREVTDNTKPIVPRCWDLPEMILTLQRQAARLRALPTRQKEPVLTEAFDLVGLREMPRQVCESCVFFHQNACAQGRPVDWQSFGEVDPRLKCSAFKRIKDELMLQ